VDRIFCPLTFVDNCAEAIVLAGLTAGGIDGEVFNVVDDETPERQTNFLKLYKAKLERSSVRIPMLLHMGSVSSGKNTLSGRMGSSQRF